MTVTTTTTACATCLTCVAEFHDGDCEPDTLCCVLLCDCTPDCHTSYVDTTDDDGEVWYCADHKTEAVQR